MSLRLATLVTAVALASSPAGADENVFQFRSVEDPAFPPDDAVCAQAPFRVNVKLGASLWSEAARFSDGRVVINQVLRVGRATACVQLTDFTFPSGLQQNFYVVFDVPSGRYTASGTCTLISNDVPQTGLVLAGCALKLVDQPAAVLGGAVSSLSTFNPAHLSGFATGSLWTMQTYTSGASTPWSWPWGGSSFTPHHDPRNDDQISERRNSTANWSAHHD